MMKLTGILISLILLVGCGRSNPTPNDANKITSQQVQQLKELRAKTRSWAFTDPNTGIVMFAGWEGDDLQYKDIFDSMLYAGVLCAMGEQSQCNAARDSFCKDGRFSRYPGACEELTYNGASRDMLMGALLYIITTKDTVRAKNLVKYLQNNDYQLCKGDDRCDLSPVSKSAAWGTMGKIWDKLGISKTKEMYTGDIGDEHLIKMEAIFSGLDYNNDTGAVVDNDYELHLVMLELWLRQLAGAWSSTLSDAIDIIADRTTGEKNALVEYLQHGATRTAADYVLTVCPTVSPSHHWQWAWKPGKALKNGVVEYRAEVGNGWDCIGMIDLLIGNDNNIDNIK